MKRLIFTLIICSSALAYDYDPNDFAIDVNSYTPGMGITSDYLTYYWEGIFVYFDNPYTALGRPTIDTTGDKTPAGTGFIDYSETIPVVNVYPACRATEMVSLGWYGQITLEFNHPVADDENNPYGIDLIIFGNSRSNSPSWNNRNPETFETDSGYGHEFGVVSVSPDLINWYTYENGPFADSFAPTLGRVYDPCNADTSIGDWNLWWAEPTDPTLPLNPALAETVFEGLIVSQAALLYGQSAGGGGFDLAESGFSWVRYVMIESNNQDIPEIDAVSDVSCCGDYKHPFPAGDFSQDCAVNFYDFAILVQDWQADTADYIDLIELSENWLKCSWQCEN